MQMYGCFEGFPLNSALFGFIMTPVAPLNLEACLGFL